uniref:UBC core domain-containing protein n=1 Tax=Panagrolaimus sp. ES5 TaxID=591445 RepID=A0AC34FC36_9BILA
MSSSKSSSSSSSNASKSSSGTGKRLKVTVNPAQFKCRLDTELRYFKAHSKDTMCKYKLVAVEEEHRRWNVLFFPDKEPYNVGGYRMIIDFPLDYPFRPPSMLFKTKTYHPNIGEKGNMELGFFHIETWKPTTRIFQICDCIISMLNYPQPSIAVVRKEIAEQMIKNREAFKREAAAYSKSQCEAFL